MRWDTAKILRSLGPFRQPRELFLRVRRPLRESHFAEILERPDPTLAVIAGPKAKQDD